MSEDDTKVPLPDLENAEVQVQDAGSIAPGLSGRVRCAGDLGKIIPERKSHGKPPGFATLNQLAADLGSPESRPPGLGITPARDDGDGPDELRPRTRASNPYEFSVS